MPKVQSKEQAHFKDRYFLLSCLSLDLEAFGYIYKTLKKVGFQSFQLAVCKANVCAFGRTFANVHQHLQACTQWQIQSTRAWNFQLSCFQICRLDAVS